MNNLRANLVQLMHQHSLTQQALATAAGVQQSTISRLLSPNAPEPQASTLQKLGAVFGVSVDELLNGTIEGSNTPEALRRMRWQRDSANQHLPGPIAAYDVAAVEDGDEVPVTHAAIQHMDFQISAGAGSELPVFAETKYPMLYRIDWFHRHRARPENVKSMGVRGASMERTLFDGDRIAVHLADRTVVNDAVFALILDGEAVVKRLFRHGPRGLRIVSDNEDKMRYPDILVGADELDDRVSILGRVIDKSGAGGL